ncbi:intraflagellar transport protein 20 homolog isoform X2 [Orussus abietinus]|uniref:intraflagellar transport protein 20 homolog isoform X2 n=1 Tax=Orussus abietinus TaxID=222816 RepID=UPI000626E552|nr:intraflagellar transport protein 20 homolog isoform X2 [Orussus abietinus]
MNATYICIHLSVDISLRHLSGQCETTPKIKYVYEISDFQKNSEEFIQLIDGLANEVEKERMRTIGARNLLRSITKQRDAQKQQIQALIIEKSMELERLRIQFDSLKKIELEQLETIEHLTTN